MDHVEWRLWPCEELCAFRQFANDPAIFRGRAIRKNAKARLEAELLRD
jgi:hypothetical protein